MLFLKRATRGAQGFQSNKWDAESNGAGEEDSERSEQTADAQNDQGEPPSSQPPKFLFQGKGASVLLMSFEKK